MTKTLDVPERQLRSGEIVRADGDTVQLSFSSEAPVKRWWGTEVLGHGDGEIDLEWIGSGRAPVLVDHVASVDHQVGVIERVTVANGRATADIRFGKGEYAQEIQQRVDDGELTAISVGYRIDELTLQSKTDDEEVYRATRWTPRELSIVSIPADPSVGVGRASETVRSVTLHTMEIPMSKETTQTVTTPPPEPAPARSSEPAVDPEKVRDQALKDERERISAITQTARRHNAMDLADVAIRDGHSTAQFNAALLERFGQDDLETRTQANHARGLTENEARDFSFLKLIRALANPRDQRAQEDAAFEFDVVVEGQKKDPHSGARGLAVPIEVLRQPIDLEAAKRAAGQFGQRGLVVGTPTAGGNLVADNLLASSFIDLLRNRMMVRRMGATMLSGLVGDVSIPRQTGGATTYWVGEGGAPTESNLTVDQVAMSPKTVGAFTQFTRKLMLQSSIDVEALVRVDLAMAIALAVDRAALHGSGSSNEPTGIAATTGIGSVVGGTNGAAPDWADVVDLETAVAQDNADEGAVGYLTNAKVRGTLKQTEKASGTAQFVWSDARLADGMNVVNGYRAGVSNQVASDLTKGTASGIASAIFFGNWADLMIGMWSGLDILVDPFTNSTSGGTRVTALQDVDVAVRHPVSFSAMLDALTQ